MTLEGTWAELQLRPYQPEVLVGPWLDDRTLRRANLDKFKSDYEQARRKHSNPLGR